VVNVGLSQTVFVGVGEQIVGALLVLKVSVFWRIVWNVRVSARARIKYVYT
jgi:hypothetical protein